MDRKKHRQFLCNDPFLTGISYKTCSVKRKKDLGSKCQIKSSTMKILYSAGSPNAQNGKVKSINLTTREEGGGKVSQRNQSQELDTFQIYHSHLEG